MTQGFGAQLATVEDLAFGDGIGEEVDEDGVGGAVVDEDPTEREIVDGADERVAQVDVLGAAQGQGDVEAAQGRAVADGDDGDEPGEAAELPGGEGEGAGHRHRGDVGVHSEVSSQLREPRLPGDPAG